ncbi:MAG: hypothetical protein HRU41_41715 [Saprospiraceae bacterium]|nr:hypothetical protein [Saprospiraceae bacterium]
MRQLTTKTKLFYGLGFSAQGIKDGLFQLFLFFYFSQVLGLDPALAGLTTFNAVYRSRYVSWGRIDYRL